jgi:hypothetical protein
MSRIDTSTPTNGYIINEAKKLIIVLDRVLNIDSMMLCFLVCFSLILFQIYVT